MASHSVYLRVAVRSSISRTMFSRILAIFAIFLIAFSDVESAPAVKKVARQFLPAIPGFVPVYIRPGDTPLEDINPDLAEAFNSYAQKHARLTFARANSVREDEGKIFVHVETPAVATQEFKKNALSAKSSSNEPQHIQKIPRV